MRKSFFFLENTRYNQDSFKRGFKVITGTRKQEGKQFFLSFLHRYLPSLLYKTRWTTIEATSFIFYAIATFISLHSNKIPLELRERESCIFRIHFLPHTVIIQALYFYNILERFFNRCIFQDYFFQNSLLKL